MKKKLIGAITIITAISTCFVGCGSKSDSQTKDKTEGVAEKVVEPYIETIEKTNEYDAIMKSAYEYYRFDDFTGLVTYNASDEVKTAANEMIEANQTMDRYVYAIGNGSYVMLYLKPAVSEEANNTLAWYFGEMSNGIRQGEGASIIVYEGPAQTYAMYKGAYKNDFPAGDGVFSYNGSITFSMQGTFNGKNLNGTYTVSENNPNATAETTSGQLAYENNHLTTDTLNNMPFSANLNEGEEIFLYVSQADGEYSYISYPTATLDAGFDIFEGNENILTK